MRGFTVFVGESSFLGFTFYAKYAIIKGSQKEDGFRRKVHEYSLNNFTCYCIGIVNNRSCSSTR